MLPPDAYEMANRELSEACNAQTQLRNNSNDLANLKRAGLQQFAKQMIRKRQGFWRPISQGGGDIATSSKKLTPARKT
jgi:hypothetical protein